jgi:hypothetical protein
MVRTHLFMASGVIFSLSFTSCPSGDLIVTYVQKPGFHFFFLRLYLYPPITHILKIVRAEKGEKEYALYQSLLTGRTFCDEITLEKTPHPVSPHYLFYSTIASFSSTD